MESGSDEIQKTVMRTLPAVMGSVLKKASGKGPDRIRIHFYDNDIIVSVFGFINKGLEEMNLADNPQMAETARVYYYGLTKGDFARIRKFFKDSYNLEVQRVFCDFDIAANEAVYVFRYE